MWNRLVNYRYACMGLDLSENDAHFHSLCEVMLTHLGPRRRKHLLMHSKRFAPPTLFTEVQIMCGQSFNSNKNKLISKEEKRMTHSTNQFLQKHNGQSTWDLSGEQRAAYFTVLLIIVWLLCQFQWLTDIMQFAYNYFNLPWSIFQSSPVEY